MPLSETLKLASFNVYSLSQVVKRKAMFEKLKKLNCISLLQETHSTNENEKRWKNEWEGNIIFSHGTSNIRGTAILIPKNTEYQISDKYIDTEGRLIILKLKIEQNHFVIANMYAPTRDHKNMMIQNIEKRLTPYWNL